MKHCIDPLATIDCLWTKKKFNAFTYSQAQTRLRVFHLLLAHNLHDFLYKLFLLGPNAKYMALNEGTIPYQFNVRKLDNGAVELTVFPGKLLN